MSTEKLEKYLFKASEYLIYFIAVIPLLFYRKLFFLDITTKEYLFRSSVELIALFFVILLIINHRKYRFRFSWLAVPVVAYNLFYFASYFWSFNPQMSLWGTTERMGGIIGQAHYLTFFIILISLFKEKKYWQNFFRVSLFASLLVCLYAVLQFFQIDWGGFVVYLYRDRLSGTLGNPIFLAGYLLFQFFIISWLYLNESRKKWRWFYLAVFVFEFLIFLGTKTRGAMLGLGAALFIILISYLIFSQTKRKTKFKIISAFATLLIIIAALYGARNTNLIKNMPLLHRYLDISLTTATAQTRFWTWESGLKGWRERPLSGWGAENFTPAFNKYFDPRHFTGFGSEAWFDRAHNDLVDILVMTGAIGLILYLMIYVFYFWRIIAMTIKNHSRYLEFSLFLGIIAAYFIQNLFIFPTPAPLIMFYALLAFGIIISNNQEDSDKIKTENKLVNSLWFLVLLLFFIIIDGNLLYRINYIPYKTNIYMTYAIRTFDLNFDVSLSSFTKALSYAKISPLGREEIYKNLTAKLIDAANYQQISQTQFLQGYNLLEPSYAAYVQNDPGDSRPLWLLGRLYNSAYAITQDRKYLDKAEPLLKQGLTYSPNRFELIFELAQTYVSRSENQKAISLFEEALEIYPELPSLYWYLGSTYQLSNDFANAQKNFDQAIKLGFDYTKDMSSLMQYTNLAIQQANYPLVIELYTKAFALRPDDYRIPASLAAAYLEIGDQPSAKSWALKSLALNPSPEFKQEVETFLQQIQ